MEITKREVMFSMILVFVLCAVGFALHDSMYNSVAEENEQYYKAIKILDDPALFDYTLETRAGTILAHGTFKAVTPVTDPEVKGQYMYLNRIHEKYTMHTRTVTTTVNGKPHTRTETYWTWDYAGSEENGTKQFDFLEKNLNFKASDFPVVNLSEDDLKVESSGGYIDDGINRRYHYEAVKDNGGGSLYTTDYLETYKLYHAKTPEEILEGKQVSQNRFHIIFWIVASFVIAMVIAIFCKGENKWLE